MLAALVTGAGALVFVVGVDDGARVAASVGT
jgi:hypothetical protein